MKANLKYQGKVIKIWGMVIDLESIIIFKITKDFYLLLGLAWILHVYKLSKM